MDLSEVLDFRASHCFLVGAGISIDSPSCLLSGGDFLFRIARHVSPRPQIVDVLSERACLSFSQSAPELILDEQDAALHMSNPRSNPLLKPHASVARCVA